MTAEKGARHHSRARWNGGGESERDGSGDNGGDGERAHDGRRSGAGVAAAAEQDATSATNGGGEGLDPEETAVVSMVTRNGMRLSATERMQGGFDVCCVVCFVFSCAGCMPSHGSFLSPKCR